MKRIAMLLLVVLLIAPACSKKATPSSSGGTPSGQCNADVTGAIGKKPNVTLHKGAAPKQLVKTDVITGTGDEAKVGKTVSVQYVGVSCANAQQFDASWNRGEPFPFALGGGQVIAGWDQGVGGMKVGGRRVLIIPPELAYGAQGQGPIGPNETLVFVVDLQKVG